MIPSFLLVRVDDYELSRSKQAKGMCMCQTLLAIAIDVRVQY